MTESIDNAERVVPEAEKPDQDFPDGLTKCSADELQSGDTAAGVEHSRCGATHDSKSVIGQREDENLSVFSGLIEVFGNPGEGLLSDLVAQAANTVPDGERLGKCNLKYALTTLQGISPQDPLEGLLAVQMIGAHNLAMEFLKRAALQEQTEYGVDVNVNRATKLLRVFATQVEALKRYRSKGEQKVQVEHVHVSHGGQAIVGSVHHTASRLPIDNEDLP